MRLFDSTEHDLDGPASHTIDTYTFFDRSSRYDVGKVRDDLESWFSYFPEHDKKDLKAQFKSNFSSCFFELYLHEIFRRLGYTLAVHPAIEGTGKRPDFFAEGHGTAFYLEAKEATNTSFDDQKEKKRLNALYEVLDKMPSPNHFIRMNKVQFKSKENQPSSVKISKYFQKILAQLDPDVMEQTLLAGGIAAIPIFRYEDDLAIVEISPIPKSKEGRNKPGRTIGMYSSEPQWMSNDVSIKNAIKNKASRYGKLDLPYIVCVNATGTIGIDEHEVLNALFGSLAIEYNINAPTPDERYVRQKDGIFLGPTGPQHTRVSAVFVTNVNPGTYRTAEHRLILHPAATLPLDPLKVGLNYTQVSGGNLEKITLKALHDVLNDSPDQFPS